MPDNRHGICHRCCRQGRICGAPPSQLLPTPTIAVATTASTTRHCRHNRHRHSWYQRDGYHHSSRHFGCHRCEGVPTAGRRHVQRRHNSHCRHGRRRHGTSPSPPLMPRLSPSTIAAALAATTIATSIAVTHTAIATVATTGVMAVSGHRRCGRHFRGRRHDGCRGCRRRVGGSQLRRSTPPLHGPPLASRQRLAATAESVALDRPPSPDAPRLSPRWLLQRQPTSRTALNCRPGRRCGRCCY